MSAAHDDIFGPYTAEDLHTLPDEGKRFELVDGWLIELSPSAAHNLVVEALHWILKSAAVAAGADVFVTSEPDISTPSGVRRPDVAVIDRKAAHDSGRLVRSTFYGADVFLVVEVVSRGSGSEREDRTRKLTEYAKSGIPQYWIIDFDPVVRVQMYQLDAGVYERAGIVDEGQTLQIDKPLRVAFDPRELVTWRELEA